MHKGIVFSNNIYLLPIWKEFKKKKKKKILSATYFQETSIEKTNGNHFPSDQILGQLEPKDPPIFLLGFGSCKS